MLHEKMRYILVILAYLRNWQITDDTRRWLSWWSVTEVVGSNPTGTGVRGCLTFSVWAHCLARAIAQKILFRIFKYSTSTYHI